MDTQIQNCSWVLRAGDPKVETDPLLETRCEWVLRCMIIEWRRLHKSERQFFSAANNILMKRGRGLDLEAMRASVAKAEVRLGKANEALERAREEEEDAWMALEKAERMESALAYAKEAAEGACTALMEPEDVKDTLEGVSNLDLGAMRTRVVQAETLVGKSIEKAKSAMKEVDEAEEALKDAQDKLEEEQALWAELEDTDYMRKRMITISKRIEDLKELIKLEKLARKGDNDAAIRFEELTGRAHDDYLME